MVVETIGMAEVCVIAAGFQSPGAHGKRFAELASCGTVSDPEGLLGDIRREFDAAEGDDEALTALSRLQWWLVEEHIAVTGPVWPS